MTDCPRGDERSKINLTDPSGFGADPMGEQCVCVNGGDGKGPDVCPRVSSFKMASVTRWALFLADRRLRGLVLGSSKDPLKPMSKPYLNPVIRYCAVLGQG